MLEDAIEHDTPVHVSSWDITRAFDSVSKNIMRLAWSRLGVPDDWLEWLVAMDVNGLTVVRTPHAIKIWDKHGMDKFTTRTKHTSERARLEEFVCPGREPRHSVDDDANPTAGSDELSAEGFSAERGTGQGDVTSPACWGAFSIQSTPQRQQIHTELTETLTTPPTLCEFEEAIRKARTNSAAGMTGVSYNTLKKLPGGMVQSLHYCLVRVWEEKSTPEWWTKNGAYLYQRTRRKSPMWETSGLLRWWTRSENFGANYYCVEY